MSLKTNAQISVITAIFSTIVCMQAHAELSVYAPQVEESILELESHNEYVSDHRPANDNKRKHYLELSYGVNEWLGLALEGEIEKEKSESYEYTATEISSTIVFTQPNEYWLDAGVRLAAEKSHEKAHADSVEAILLAQKIIGDYTTLANVKFGREVGNFRSHDTSFGVAAKVSYNYTPAFNPGIEYYWDNDDVAHLHSYGNQVHRIGPVANGSFAAGWEYEAGVLFGVSHTSEDVVGKITLAYEFPI